VAIVKHAAMIAVSGDGQRGIWKRLFAELATILIANT
jgi:hypothetical protein